MRSIKLPSWVNRALGAGSRSSPPQVFAVGEGVLSYVRFIDSGDQLQLVEHQEIPLPEQVIGSGPVGGPVRDQAALDSLVAAMITGLEEPISQASLVLPDSWARLVFVETADLPNADRARDEALRWALKQQVPFRVEDLRVRAEAVTPLQDQEQPSRLLVGFGVEQVLAGLESAFRKAGVQIGDIANRSIAFADGAAGGRGGEAFLWGFDNGYSLVVLDRREPVLFRSKRLEPGLDLEVISGMVERELRLTLGFLEKRRPEIELDQLVVAGQEDSGFWVEAARRGMLAAGADLGTAAPDVVTAGTAVSGRVDWSRQALIGDRLMPLFGAAQRSVA